MPIIGANHQNKYARIFCGRLVCPVSNRNARGFTLSRLAPAGEVLRAAGVFWDREGNDVASVDEDRSLVLVGEDDRARVVRPILAVPRVDDEAGELRGRVCRFGDGAEEAVSTLKPR